LHVGPLELPSDLIGITYIDISKGIEAAGEEIRRELKNVIEKS
jgi:predicted nucleotide-binding protein